MKKLLSMILALSLLLSMIPAALALESSAPVEELPMDAVTAQEDLFTVDALPQEEVQLISAPVSDPGTAEGEEALARYARAETRAEVARMKAESAGLLSAPGFEFSPMAASCSVTVKVTLPQAATAESQVRLAVHVPAKVEESGLVSEYSYRYDSKWVSVNKGSSTASATFTVPAGSYFVSVYTYDPHLGIAMNKYHYFNADGSLAANEYTAQPTAVSGSKTFSVRAPKADGTISGKLEFSSPLTEDTWFQIYMGTGSRTVGNSAYPELFAPKGSTSLSFTLPMATSSYYLEFRNYSNGKWGYYDVNGGLSYDWEARTVISLFDGSVSGLVIDGDWLLGEVEETEDSNWHDVNITVKLPETLTENRQYFVLLFNGNNTSELYDWFYCDGFAGKSSFDLQISLRENFSYSLGYLDVTGWSSYSWTDYYPTARYLSEDGGITSMVENAKTFTMGTENMSVTIDDSSNYKLTGTVALPAARKSDLAVFPMVEFENGEIFGARTLFWAGDTSVKYTIYVPKNQSGSFLHWAAEAEDGLSIMLDGETMVEGKSYTLANNLSLSTITMLAEPPLVPCLTVSLPEGMTAPKGGLALWANVPGVPSDLYYMAEGESSVTVSAPAIDSTRFHASVSVLNAPDDLFDNYSSLVNKVDSSTLPVLTLPEAVTVSGSIVVPDTAKDGISSFTLSLQNYFEDFTISSDNLSLSTLPGETSVAFTSKVAKGVESRIYARLLRDGSGYVVSQNQYLQADGTSSSSNTRITLTEDLTNAALTFAQGSPISGTISLAEGLPGDLYTYEVRFSGDNYWLYSSGSFNGTSTDYRFALPSDYTGTWRVSCSLYYEGSEAPAVMVDTEFYYSESGITRKHHEASLITAPASDIDFVFPAGYSISGTVTLPEELNGYEYGGNVVAIDKDWNHYYGHFSYYRNSYTIMVPTDYTGTYMLGIYGYAYNDNVVPGLITSTMYLTEDGNLTPNQGDAKKFTVGEAGLKQDFTLPLGKTFSLDISAPDGFSGYYEGNVSFVDEDQNTVCEKYFEFSDSSITVPLTVLSDLAEGSYALRIYLHNGEGALVNQNRYWSENGWVSSFSDADFIDFSTGELAITLPGAKSAAITVNAPEGFSGYYEGRIYLYEDYGTSGGWNNVASQYFEFEGSSCDLNLYLPADSENSIYKLGVYLWSGPGCPTDHTYYYAEAGWSTSYSSGDYVDFSSASISITLPRAKVISGRLVSAQGDAISLPENGIGFNLRTSSGDYVDFSSTSDSEGNFTLSVPDNLTGTYYLYCYPTASDGSNVVDDSYYYKAGATSAVTEYNSDDSTYLFSLDNGDVTGLEIYVNTGYVLSGTIALGEGATLTNPDSKTLGRLYISLESEDYSTEFSYRLRSDNPQWTYSIAVPKAEATYTVSAYLAPNSSAATNIYTGTTNYGTVQVSGSGNMPAITLVPGRATISATVTTPLSGYYTNGQLSVVTKNGTYSRSFYMDNDVSSTTVSVSVAPDDKADTYQLYYYLWNPQGLLLYKNVYVNADGSYTVDPETATSYSFEVLEHSITLAEQPPLISGKIYLPETLDDTDFYVWLYDSFTGTSSIRVNSSTIQEDEEGRKYVPYKKYSNSNYSGSSFFAYYYLSDYTGTALYDKNDYYSRAYLGENGTYTFGGNSDHHYFTVPNSGCAELDFALLSWNDGTEDFLLQSGHGLSAFEEQTFTFSYPGATYLYVTFDSRTDIELYINGSWYSAYSLRGSTKTIYLGNTDGVMTITVPALDDLDYTYAFGFAITDIVPYYSGEAAQTPSVAAVYSADGSAEADVMESLTAGETVRVSLVGPAETSGVLAAAVYDINGRMIGLVWEGITFDESGCAALPLDFEGAENAATLTLMLLDGTTWVPLMDAPVLSAAN